MKSGVKYGAEVFGTFVLVFFGTGSVVIGNTGILPVGLLGIAFAFGIAIVAMAYAIGPISGCHLNPAVTLAMWINKRMKAVDALMYMVSQIVGAIIASALIFAILKILGISTTGNMGQNTYTGGNAGSLGIGGGLLVEIILTFVFVTVIICATGKHGAGNFAGLAIGLTLVMVHIVGINLTGTSVNPARSIGPALFAGTTALKELWVFIVAPLVGGALAAFAGKFLFKSEIDVKEK